MRIEDLKPGILVEYKRNGVAGAYEARVEGFTGGRVILKVFRHLWSGTLPPRVPDPAEEDIAPIVRVKPSRILKVRT